MRLIGKLIYGIVTKPDIAYARISESIYAQAKDFDRDPTRTDIFSQKTQDLSQKMWTFLFALGYVLLCFKFYL